MTNKELWERIEELEDKIDELKEIIVDKDNEIDDLNQEIEALEDFIPKLQATKNRLDKNNYELTMNLKQRDEVIDDIYIIN